MTISAQRYAYRTVDLIALIRVQAGRAQLGQTVQALERNLPAQLADSAWRVGQEAAVQVGQVESGLLLDE
ncbi:MAG: hypothetical protein OEU26_16230 [Candidatus Tectomicrobia bacterium]|nr:hypothetical protein [Candidatus Tectomicrobia bacterium]